MFLCDASYYDMVTLSEKYGFSSQYNEKKAFLQLSLTVSVFP